MSDIQGVIDTIQIWREHVKSDVVIAGYLQAFLIVGKAGYLPMSQVAKQMNVRNSHVSKVFQILGSSKDEGYGLVKWDSDPKDTRLKIVSLTWEGIGLYEKIAKVLGCQTHI